MASGRPGSTSPSSSGMTQPALYLDPLAQITTGERPRSRPATSRTALRRADQQQRVAAGEFTEIAGRL